MAEPRPRRAARPLRHDSRQQGDPRPHRRRRDPPHGRRCPRSCSCPPRLAALPERSEGLANAAGDARLVQLSKLLRVVHASTPRQGRRSSTCRHPAVPDGHKCPAEVAPGIRPRDLDGFHYDGDGAAWLAEPAHRHARRHHTPPDSAGAAGMCGGLARERPDGQPNAKCAVGARRRGRRSCARSPRRRRAGRVPTPSSR